ncbi:MAG: HipA domain-containing protein [Bacilli bacterium]|nr:HipA domain-containing protein [Bacilli bacterium]
MKKYDIKQNKKDFWFLENTTTMKGTRPKRIVKDFLNRKAIFKYEHPEYICSEACSEKISYEIAKVLNYNCAEIEFGKDEDGKLGILNYIFLDVNKIEHIDAVSYLNRNNDDRSKFYTISNIKKSLDDLNKNLFYEFLKIMVFDALVGEQDRHEENWGITSIDGEYFLSPLYDNGCNLLREFKDEKLSNKYYSKEKSFDAYILRSKTIIYKEDENTQYRHFELIEYLNELYNDEIQNELNKLNNLTDEIIEDIVNKVPDELLTDIHKAYIIHYLKTRRNILLNIK